LKTWFYLYRATREPVRLYRTVTLPGKAGVVRITHRSYDPHWANEYLFRLSIGRYPEHYPFYEAHVKLYDPHTGGASKPVTAEYEFPLLSAWGGRTVTLEAEFQTVLWPRSYYNWVDVEILPGDTEVRGVPVALMPVAWLEPFRGPVEFSRTVEIPRCERLHLALQALLRPGLGTRDIYLSWLFRDVELATHRYVEDIELENWAYTAPTTRTVENPPSGRDQLKVRVMPYPSTGEVRGGRLYGWAIAEGAAAPPRWPLIIGALVPPAAVTSVVALNEARKLLQKA